jgi:osmotically inducible lipoprotein OsmB
MKRMTLAILASAGLALAACGNTPGERAVTGGLLGAGGGAAIGSLSGNAGAGALIGGAVGAVGGAVTAPQNRGYYR